MHMPGTQPRWWHGATLYQIYVRSWQDTNDDGYGDLNGVTAHLDYLTWLGVDGIWLSPTMPSPDDDWGYDVSDYLGVHPELGTLADLDRLIAEAGQRDMRVLLDLVPNHTSSAHPWFVEAVSDPASPHREFYVWADPAPDGGPPNNWLAATGASAWTLDQASGQYYLHNFLPSQPDLNWWNPAVHQAFQDILRFWFDWGVAGFRIDVAHGLYKDAELRDDPPVAGSGPIAGRYGHRPVFSANRPETHGVYRDWRKIADDYQPPRLLLGETWVGDLGRLAAFYGNDDELQLAFNFPFVFARLAAGELSGIVGATLERLPAGACPVWTASNHDVGRFPTRWCGGDERKVRLALMVQVTLPGTTVLYYGDEIGMTDVRIPVELRRDHMSRQGTGWDGSRDRGRTPMQWDASPSAGFTAEGVTPWLPVGDAAACNVAGQRDDPASVLRFCRSLLALRRAEFRGAIVPYELLTGDGGLWAYRAGPLTVAANLSDQPAVLAGPVGQILLSTVGEPPAPGAPLGPWQGLIART